MCIYLNFDFSNSWNIYVWDTCSRNYIPLKICWYFHFWMFGLGTLLTSFDLRFGRVLFLSSDHKFLVQIAKKNNWRVSKKLLKFAFFLVKNKGGKKIGKNQQFFTRQTVFALICTVLFYFPCNFRFQLEMNKTVFDILVLNI